jgi:hypothetical protein
LPKIAGILQPLITTYPSKPLGEVKRKWISPFYCCTGSNAPDPFAIHSATHDHSKFSNGSEKGVRCDSTIVRFDFGIVLYETEIVPSDFKILRYDVEIVQYDPENTIITINTHKNTILFVNVATSGLNFAMMRFWDMSPHNLSSSSDFE